MNIAAGKSLNERREQLADAVATLRQRLDAVELVAFDDSQEKWQLYCDTWADFVAGRRVGGGTIWPLIYASAAEEVSGYMRLSDGG